jgi:hypothetical protein
LSELLDDCFYTAPIGNKPFCNLQYVHSAEGVVSVDGFDVDAVSRIRQPIEALFGWIQEKTGIQTASKVRSERGLMVHVFGRIAAAMLLLAFNS